MREAHPAPGDSSATTRRRWSAALVATAAALIATAPVAHAEPIAQVGVSGSGIIGGNVVQIPVTAIVLIQVCNNNIVAGLIAVSVDVLGVSACIS